MYEEVNVFDRKIYYYSERRMVAGKRGNNIVPVRGLWQVPVGRGETSRTRKE